jgi:hypothetical protein
VNPLEGLELRWRTQLQASKRKRTGIEPAKPTLARGFIGFEDRGRHQSGTRFRWRR